MTSYMICCCLPCNVYALDMVAPLLFFIKGDHLLMLQDFLKESKCHQGQADFKVSQGIAQILHFLVF